MNFPINDSGQFSAQRLYTPGTFASLIIVSTSDNILTASVVKELQKLDMAVKNLTSKSGANFNQLCAQVNGSTCVSANPVFTLKQNNNKDVLLTYPQLHNGVFVGLYVGGVLLGPDNVLLKAKALRFLYYLREDSDTVHISIEWLNHFMKSISHLIEELHLRYIKVYHSTSISLQTEFEESTETVIPLFSITYVVTILFSIVSCASLDNVRNKIWVITFGVISPGLAIMASFGLLLLCKVPFARTVANAPFLILGVGVDNMFIIISCWKQTKVTSTVEERMADTYQEAAVSITITTLTDVLAFYIGIMTHFPSVKSFCIYTGTALVFCYIYCITFFGAILALNRIHENNNRHWLVCMKISDKRDNEQSWLYNACCVGEALDTSQEKETEHPITIFFYKYYGPFLTKPWAKVLVLIIYLLYLSASIYGCVQTKDGIDIRDLAKANSSLTHFYDIEALYFSEYGPRVMVVVTSKADYWETKAQDVIETCIQSLENNCYIAKGYSTSWLRAYEEMSKRENLNISTKEIFLKNLDKMFENSSDFRQDIRLEGGEIKASRFFIQAVNVINVDNAKAMLTHLRDIANNCSFKVIVYHPLFIYLDQYFVIIQNTIQNIIVATAVMLVISVLLIPDPLCSLWVTFDIASIIAGVTGFMSFWKVNLDSISMINLVICIGFSVDFSAHIVYACVANRKRSVNERMIDALHLLGYPIVQGALSTILGISALSAAESYIFRTFFKIMLLVLLFGALHGLLFIPVFLITVGSCGMQCSNDVYPKDHEGEDANDLPPAVIYRVHPLTFESHVRKAKFSLPGYTSTVHAVQDCGNLSKECYCMSWQGSIYSVLHSQNRQIDEDSTQAIVEYRNKMLQVYVEYKND
ncbi:PREDICTED: patched domain-containing protein 3-like [Nanorana parkeri]|uniref:patched domain-containing protein 3-like n=1 Tax=Nanorana parkeri TaxID=125878 RepID=UPI0008545EEE|nr:PREDICTED: patched domain-containing protein 3-like [Nanorana parkeri]